jgi:hypothetical protein
MSDKPISDLRRRMIADMTIRSFGDKTQRDYIRHIETFARFLGRSPDTATGDDIRRFQLKAGWGSAESWLRNQVSYDLWRAKKWAAKIKVKKFPSPEPV